MGSIIFVVFAVSTTSWFFLLSLLPFLLLWCICYSYIHELVKVYKENIHELNYLCCPCCFCYFLIIFCYFCYHFCFFDAFATSTFMNKWRFIIRAFMGWTIFVIIDVFATLWFFLLSFLPFLLLWCLYNFYVHELVKIYKESIHDFHYLCCPCCFYYFVIVFCYLCHHFCFFDSFATFTFMNYFGLTCNYFGKLLH